jgi:hypothetical protein
VVANIAAKLQFASQQLYSRKGNGGLRKRTVMLENLFFYQDM